MSIERCTPEKADDMRDVLEKADTALANIADWERRYGKGINLAPIIAELRDEVRRLRIGIANLHMPVTHTDITDERWIECSAGCGEWPCDTSCLIEEDRDCS